MATSPDSLEVLGLQSIENAPDADTGQDWLIEDYSSARWSDPERASQILSDYGNKVRQKFSSNSAAVQSGLEQYVPLALNQLPDPDIADPQERAMAKIDAWEAANIDALSKSIDPQQIVRRDILNKFVSDSALTFRRRVNNPGVVEDTAARFAAGVIAPVTGLFGAPEPEFLKEHTSPQRDDDFMSELVSGAGTVGTAIAATAAAPVAGAVYLGAGAVGSVGRTVLEVKEETGSNPRAAAAGAIDAVGQGVGLVFGAKAAGRVVKAGTEGLAAATETLAKGGTVEAAKEVFKQGARTAILQGGANVSMGVGARGARRVGLDDENIDVLENTPREFAVGAILGVGGEAAARGYNAVGRRISARLARRAQAVEGSETPPSPESAAAEIVEPGANVKAETDAALQEIAKELPSIDQEGIAHQRTEQSVYKAPATAEQVEQAKGASRFFTTNTGDQYELFEDGTVGHRTGPSGPLAPGDTMRFVTPEDAAKLLTLKTVKPAGGEESKIYTDKKDGELFVYSQHATDDLDLSEVPTGSRFIKVQSQREPAPGLVPVSANIPAVSDGKKVFSSNIGNTIKDVVTRPERVTPADPTTLDPNSRVRMLGQRVVDNQNLPTQVRDAFMTLNDKGERESTLRYIPQGMAELQSQGGMWIAQRGGSELALLDILEGGNNISNEAQAGAFQLTASLGRAIIEAQRKGDVFAETKLVDLQAALTSKIAEIGTYRGQGVNQLKDAQRIDPDNAFAFQLGQITKAATDEVLAKEGISRPDVERAQTRVRELDEAIKAAKEDVALKAKLQAEKEALEKKINDRTNAIKKLVGKKFSPEKQEEYRNLLQLRAQLPEGPLRARQDSLIDAIEYKLQTPWLKRFIKGAQNFYVGNILSELGTWAATAYGNSVNVASGIGEVIGGSAFREGGGVRKIPENFVEFVRQMTRSVPKATRNSIDTFFHKNLNKFEAEDFLLTGAPVLRYVGWSARALSALDTWATTLVRDPAMAVRLVETRPDIASLTGEARRTAIDEALFGNAEFRRSAEVEADRQIEIAERFGQKMSARDKAVIVDDIIERQRPQNLAQELTEWTDKIALRGKPKGFSGDLTGALKVLAKSPGLDKFILFMNAMGNLMDYGLEFSPYGFARPTALKLRGQEIGPLERSAIYTRALMGTTAAAGIYAAWQAGAFDINGAGPANPEERRAWKAAGGKPYTFQRGDSIIQFGWWPMAPTLAAIAGYADYQKYSKDKTAIKEHEAINYIMSSTFQGMFASPLTSNFGELVEIGMTAARGGDAWAAMERFGQRIGADVVKNSVLPFNRLMRNFSGMFQDPLDTRQAWSAKFLSGIPFAGASGLPRLNMFGEPINDGKHWTERWNSIGRFYIQQTQDPRFRFLTEKGYYIRQLPYRVTIPDEGFRYAKRSREARLGLEFTDVFTDRENYEMQKIAGPMLSDLVLEFRERYSNGPWDERVQKKLNTEVTKIYNKAKRRVVGLEIDDEDGQENTRRNTPAIR